MTTRNTILMGASRAPVASIVRILLPCMMWLINDCPHYLFQWFLEFVALFEQASQAHSSKFPLTQGKVIAERSK